MGFRPLHVFPLSSVPLYTHYLSFFVSCLSVFMSWHPILSLSLSLSRAHIGCPWSLGFFHFNRIHPVGLVLLSYSHLFVCFAPLLVGGVLFSRGR